MSDMPSIEMLPTKEVPCPTCKRLGRVPKAFPPGTVMSYCGPNGEGWPYETCRTCNGMGWITEATS